MPIGSNYKVPGAEFQAPDAANYGLQSYNGKQPIEAPQGAGEGWLRGYVMAANNKRAENDDRRAENQDIRAERSLGMIETEFGQKQEEYKKQKSINEGMVFAAQQGGYNGVIDYLEKVDPDRAVEFTGKKLALDRSIMGNEVMKATSQRDIASAMVESYGIIGKMGYSLLQAPPGDREAMYKQMLPILQKVNPDAPDNVKDAVPMLMLGVAQSIPENVMYGNKLNAQKSYSKVDGINRDIERRMAAGETVETSNELNSLVMAREGELAKAQQAQQQVNNYKYGQQAQAIKAQSDIKQQQMATQQLSHSIKSDYNKDSKPFEEFNKDQVTVTSAFDILRDPNASSNAKATAMQKLQYAYARQANGVGQLSAQDFNTSSVSAASWQAALKTYNEIINGVKTPLNADEIAGMEVINNVIKQKIEKKQMDINSYYGSKINDINDGMDTSQGRAVGINFYRVAPQKALDYLKANPTNENLKAFESKYHWAPDPADLGPIK